MTQRKHKNTQNKNQKNHIQYIPTQKGIETGKRIIETYKNALKELAKR
jgi:peptidase E